tara:strand:- start:1887 stop:2672 length:786 start_codon:yes stop_codon:yes gene_type:complete
MNYKISIVTVVLNAKNELLKTITSVQRQTYKNYEHIVKDGISDDGTFFINFSNYYNTYLYKMKDIGIYDAMNQGFEFATGDLIMFLNAGDLLFSKDTLMLINESFKKKCYSSCLVGYTIQTKLKNKKSYLIQGYGWPYRFLPLIQFPHPSFIIKKNIAEQIKPLFDYRLKIASDYKQQLIMRQKGLFNPIYIDSIITEMPMGGVSTKNSLSYLKGFIEVCKFSIVIYKFQFIYVLLLKIFLHFYRKNISESNINKILINKR